MTSDGEQILMRRCLKKKVGQKLVVAHFSSLLPYRFPVEVEIRALLVFVRDCLRLGSTLEPCQILLVKSPRLLL
jgi:hypothetical protein